MLPFDVDSYYRHKMPKHKTIIWFSQWREQDLVFASSCLSNVWSAALENNLLLGSRLRIPEGDSCSSLTQHVIPRPLGLPINICTSSCETQLFSVMMRVVAGSQCQRMQHSQSPRPWPPGFVSSRGVGRQGGWLHLYSLEDLTRLHQLTGVMGSVLSPRNS